MTRDSPPDYIDQLPPGAQSSAVAQLSDAVTRGTRQYQLHPGDTIEVMFHVSHAVETRSYRIRAGDEIEVEFVFQPTYTHTYLVRPDGRISLPGHGDVAVAGRAPLDLATQIASLYAEELNNPTVVVNPTRISTEATDLIGMLSSTTGARTQTIAVGPDGSVALPLLNSMPAVGHTIDQLRDDANAMYAGKVSNISTSIRLASVANQQSFVFGEVPRPGPVANDRPRTVLQLLAAAGGVLTTGSLENVRVLYWDSDARPHLRVVNLTNVLEKLDLDEDMIVPVNSMIYVPPTGLAKAGRFMDQLLRQTFMYNGAGFGVNYNINGFNQQ